MPLAPGNRLGPYEIVAPLGAGGMGEVYRARDTKLGREVAIKVLPDALSRNADRLARFEREAKVLAALNHPNIAIIHGLEDRAIVMELVEGPTLAERIAAGPLPLEEALGIARQVAEAVEAAHEKGVIHRDLKPANIKITPEGTVKVLDFGLATAMQAPDRDSMDPANSPTLTIAATEIGVILGTAAYMSPEQASGKRVDKRADVWSFGVVLWEMLSGRRLFAGGETVSHTLADVLRAEIDLDKIVAPPPIREMLKRCLDRDVKTRLRDIGEARVALARYLANPGGAQDTAGQAQARPTKTAWMAAGVCAVAALAAGAWAWLERPALDTHSLRYMIEKPPGTRFNAPYFGTAVSPDARLLVFTANRSDATTTTLWLRPMNSLAARELPGTENGNGMFWSPDSKSIGFIDVPANKLKRVDVLGGLPQVLCDAPAFQGATWSQDQTILFSSKNVILRVPAAGGAPTPVTRLDTAHQETAHRFPYFLPDGKRFLFTVESPLPNIEGIYVASLDHPDERVRLAPGAAKGVYALPRNGYPGYLLWLRDQTLVAQRFDGRSRVEGDPIPIADEVAVIQANWRAAFWVADEGLLVYRSGGGGAYQLHWVARDGKREVVTGAGADPQRLDPRLSPDGTRLALDRSTSTGTGGMTDVWTYEFARGVMMRLTTGPGNNSNPIWSPDGRQVAFRSDRNGVAQIYRKDSNGTGAVERLTTGGSNPKTPVDWSRDGKYILYEEQDPKTGSDIWALPLEGDRKPIPVLHTQFNENRAQFSPDGKWIAYNSDETGSTQVYIQPFPPSGEKVQVSNAGGIQPRWSGDGKELYFYVGAGSGNIWAAGIRIAGGRATVEQLRQLPVSYSRFSGNIHYDVTRDGQRFLMVQLPFASDDAQSQALTVVSNWQAGLRK